MRWPKLCGSQPTGSVSFQLLSVAFSCFQLLLVAFGWLWLVLAGLLVGFPSNPQDARSLLAEQI